MKGKPKMTGAECIIIGIILLAGSTAVCGVLIWKLQREKKKIRQEWYGLYQ